MQPWLELWSIHWKPFVSSAKKLVEKTSITLALQKPYIFIIYLGIILYLCQIIKHSLMNQ